MQNHLVRDILELETSSKEKRKAVMVVVRRQRKGENRCLTWRGIQRRG
uniref:Uncharacterized protein n=1 Tax=Brassica oleracea TaxID=3712 RepID=A0A3P6D5T3_BRAOL|nr:unnamed protein product [Brassica oleracea]